MTGEDSPVLRQKTTKILSFGKDLQRLITDLHNTVQVAKGAGLAAPQIGIPQRVCVARIGRNMTALVNPEITWRSKETATMEEGCLSLPEIWLDIERAQSIVLVYQDEKGREQERKLSDLDARVVQHEVDHLEGVLIVDRAKKPM